MKCMIQIMFDTTVPKMNGKQRMNENQCFQRVEFPLGYSPPKYTHDLLLDLCFAEETCDACFCYDDVIDLLLKPIKTILDLKKVLLNLQISRECLYFRCLFRIHNHLTVKAVFCTWQMFYQN